MSFRYTLEVRVLIIEDERRLALVIKKGLVENGFAVDLAFDGEEGKFLAESENYDLVILDLMLPKLDGLTLCQEIRQKGNKTPVLMLTAKTTLDDKVAGLNSGADDYLTKPFAFLELIARVHAVVLNINVDPKPDWAGVVRFVWDDPQMAVRNKEILAEVDKI